MVACDVCGLHENIDSYKDGITVEVSADDLAQGICEALENTDRLKTFGRTGRSMSHKKFRWKGIADRYNDLYQGIGS